MVLDVSSRTNPLWADAALPMLPPLERDEAADVCIVGAGIAGMTTAFLLGTEGRKVIVVDDGPIGGGETGHTTAHLVNALDDRYYDLERLHGVEGARAAAQSHTAAVDCVQSIIAREAIDCDFQRLDGYLIAGAPQDVSDLDRELEAVHRAGLAEVEKVPRAPAPFDTGPALRFPRQAQFHPLRYLAGLLAAIARSGGQIYCNTQAVDVSQLGNTGRLRVLMAGGQRITASHVVVATNSPFIDRLAIHSKQAPYRSYVIAVRVPRDSVERCLLWDTRQSPDTPDTDWSPVPYHYVRLQPAGDHDLLIVGGEDHKTGQDDNPSRHWDNLESWTRQRYPMAQTVERRWSGQVMEPVDGLAFIGRNPMDDPNVFICTGDSGNGMTHGTLAGMLITDLIAGRENPWVSLYDPGRKALTPLSVKRYARENLNVARQYGELLAPGDVHSADEIPPGHGAVIRRRLRPVAVYRSPDGQLHEMSAICTHLGCIVRWNAAQSSWDCPCHGSRFDCHGRVLNGPATTPLAPVEEPVDAG